MDGSNGNIVALLERIAAGQEGTREELREIRDGQDQLTAEVRQSNRRLDNIVAFMGSHHADHEQRLSALEQEVFKKSG